MLYCVALYVGLSNMGVHMLGPCVSIIFVAQCAVWVLEFERPEDVFSMIAHVLGVSEF